MREKYSNKIVQAFAQLTTNKTWNRNFKSEYLPDRNVKYRNKYDNDDNKKSTLKGIVQKALTNDSKYCPVHYEEEVAVYHGMFENVEKEADEHVAAALERDQQKYRERWEERIAKRMTRIRSIYASLEEILDDSPL